MEQNEIKKDLTTVQVIGIVLLVGLAILIGSNILLGYQLSLIQPYVTYPSWIDPLAIIVAIVVLVVIAILGIVRYTKGK
jgi:hypothetical protein